MKNKRRIIIISVAVFVVLVIVLSSAIFNVRHVQVDFYTTDDARITDFDVLEHFSADDISKISSSAKIKGRSVFLINKGKYIDNLEKANPYLKVIGLEIVFPDKVVVKVLEREEMYYYEDAEGYIVLDTELKVLRKTESKPDLILLDGIVEDTYSVSDQVELYHLSEVSKALNEAYVTNVNARALFSKFEVVEELVRDSEDTDPYRVNSLKMSTNYGAEKGLDIIIQNVDQNLGDKILKAMEVYDWCVSHPEEASMTDGTIKVLNNGVAVYNKNN